MCFRRSELEIWLAKRRSEAGPALSLCCPLQSHKAAQLAGFNRSCQSVSDVFVTPSAPLMRRESKINGDVPVLATTPDTVTSFGELLHVAADPENERKLDDISAPGADFRHHHALLFCEMNGQWIGEYAGTSHGRIIVNIDDVGPHFEGVAYLQSDPNEIPWTGVGFQTTNKNREFEFHTRNLWGIDSRTGNPATPEALKEIYPNGFTPSSHVTASGRWDERFFEASWKTDIGTVGNCKLPRSRADQPSELIAKSMDWKDFKLLLGELRGKRHLFRGQSEPCRLRTAYHRRGRANLLRFTGADIPELHRRLSVRTRHIFNLAIPDENGAFFNLVQHHGYPTPLLDWTYSPFVAAFFAYRTISKIAAARANQNEKVRVFMLDECWRSAFNQLQVLDRPFQHFSIAEFIAIENERMVPQQSVSTITNVDDIETYIRERESQNSQTFLSAIDLPVAARDEVFSELGYMGITAGSMFPGLDGSCEELRERNF